MREARRKSDALLLSEVSRRLAADPAQTLIQLVDYPADAAEWPRVLHLAIEAARLGLPEWVAHVGIHGGAAFAPDGNSLAAVAGWIRGLSSHYRFDSCKLASSCGCSEEGSRDNRFGRSLHRILHRLSADHGSQEHTLLGMSAHGGQLRADAS